MAATHEKDLYKILGVKEDANADEIKKSYRDLAKKLHPDRTGGDKSKEVRFKEISAAYEVLSDPKRREQYDLMRRGGFRTGPGGAPDFSAFEGIDGIEELFGSIFGGRGGGRGGRSRVVYETRPFSGFGGFQEQASDTARPRPVAVDEIIRTRDGHEVTRRGDDVYSDVEITIDEAVLGAKVEVPTLEGRVTITVPPGTSSGKKLRLRGKGPSGRGDHYVSVKIVVPERVDERAEELIREFAARAPARPKR
jgi:DnaJ-class molecular chaperone